MRINACTSRRVLTQRDPYVNLLRNTVGVFAGMVAGADSITSVPFDAMLEMADEFSRRVARNTVLILQEEAHLHRVQDPPGGSWFLDQLTEQVAERAWKVFQEVERQGGMLKALQSGTIHQQIEAAFTPRAKNIARRKEGITGVSEFPNVGEEPIRHLEIGRAAIRSAAIDRVEQGRALEYALRAVAKDPSSIEAAVAAASNGASIGQLATALEFHQNRAEITPLAAHFFAEPFEQLRAASDAWHARHTRRPIVFLANMGPIAHHTARAAYSKNFFEAGGFEVVTNSGFSDADTAAAAFADSGAPIAVICSSDKLYPDLVPAVAAKLKAIGARSIVLAGNPGANEQAWRAAGVNRFIFVKCDVLATLRELLEEIGVLETKVPTGSV